MTYLQLFSNQLFQLKTIDSTNNYIAKLVKEVELAEGAVVMSACQTSGKGQQGNGWHSKVGENLLFSLLLKPSFLDVKSQFYLNMIVCLALKDTLGSFGLKDVKIKWPNDILVNNRKICGVLIENGIKKDKVNQSIIGVGLNVNEEMKCNPMLKAISLFDLINKRLDLNDVLELFKKDLSKWYLLLNKKQFSKIKKSYLNDLFYFNEFNSFFLKKNGCFVTETLKIIDIDEFGCLILENKKKQLKKVALKEIKFKY